MYAMSELPCIVFGERMFLFDPSGEVLASSLAPDAVGGDGGNGGAATGGSGDARGRGGGAVGRAYPIVPADLPKRFPDQFEPLALFGCQPFAGQPLNSTLVRLPLRTHLQVRNVLRIQPILGRCNVPALGTSHMV